MSQINVLIFYKISVCARVVVFFHVIGQLVFKHRKLVGAQRAQTNYGGWSSRYKDWSVKMNDKLKVNDKWKLSSLSVSKKLLYGILWPEITI